MISESVGQGRGKEDSALAQWFLFAQGMRLLPTGPFELARGVFVADPDLFYAHCNRMLAKGVLGQFWRGLMVDLQRLKEIAGG